MKKLSKVLLSIMLTCLLFLNIPDLKAASATFKVTSNRSTVVVGNTFTVTVKVSSSSVLGSWEYTINYDSSAVKLVSGKTSVADPGNGSQKSQSYTYTFKATKSGNTTISVKSYGAFDWDEHSLSCSASGANVRIITQAELEASYSKDNNLGSLSVDGASITPEFNRDVTEYKVELGANTTSININASPNDSKAHVDGSGTFEVTEGDNKFQITVTAENGSTKVYTLIASVIDPNPITVRDINNNELVVVKRQALLTAPTSYTETTALINDQEVPAFTSEITNFTLVGLKNNDGNISLYIYNKDKNTFTKYTEIKLNDLVILTINKSENYKDYIKTKIKIGDEEIDAFKYNEKSKFAVIYAMDTENGKENYYKYDLSNNTVTFIDDEVENYLNNKLHTYSYVIIGLLGESVILFIILILLLRNKSKHNKKKKEKIEEAKMELKNKNAKNIENKELESKEIDAKQDKKEIYKSDDSNSKNKKIEPASAKKDEDSKKKKK